MAYAKQTWSDYAAGGTPISAARLNYMEAGIEEASSGAVALGGVEGIVIHDGTATGGVRPTGYARVRWINPSGTAYARPTNMVAGDVWEHDA